MHEPGKPFDSRPARLIQPEEKLNALTHLFGVVLALAGTAVLIVLAAQAGDPWKVVSVSIYGATLRFVL